MALPVFSANGLIVRYGVTTLLNSSTLALHEGERVGLVGRNGCGKSTFLRIAAGDLEPDGGEVTRRRNALVGYLPQTFGLDDSATVEQNILSGASHVLKMIEDYEATPAEDHRASELLDEIEQHDGWNLDSRLRSLVTNLHAPDIERNAANLSGGEKRRVALCRALIGQPDLLILDEPTNHLDTNSVEWLEGFLRTYKGTCLFVTHDRFFLDRVTTRIVELKGGTFYSYPGNYTKYLATKAEREAGEESSEHERQKYLARELEWVRKGPSARRTKSVDRIARYHEMAAEAGPMRDDQMDMIIPPPPKLGNTILDLKDVGVKLGDRVLFDRLNFEMPPGSRIGIVGRNGMGKTTLLRVIMGELEPTWGKVTVGQRTIINYVDQNRAVVDDNDTVLTAIAGTADWVVLGEEKIHVRTYLRRFLFTDEAINSKVGNLSGGERSRLTLGKVLLRGGNLLILDEPTNDLDLSTLQLVEESLAQFTGCALVVSHDRWFLNRVCTHILSIEEGGVIEFTPGDYDYYLEKKAARLAAPVPVPVQKVVAPVAPKPRGRKLTYKEQKELETIEAEIHRAEAEVAATTALLADPQFFVTRSREFPEQERKLGKEQAIVARLYARWAELEEIKAAQG